MANVAQTTIKHYIFVRHGESTDNREGLITGLRDPSLTVKGADQARQTGKWIATNVQAVYPESSISIISSPLRRALGTATLIADGLNVPRWCIFHTQLLQERSRGDLEGTPRRAYSEQDLLDHGSESIEALNERALAAIGYLASLNSDLIVVVSHRNFLGYLIRHFTGEPINPEELANAKPILVNATTYHHSL